MRADLSNRRPATRSRNDSIAALMQLGEFIASFEWEKHHELHECLVQTLLDTLGVMVAGAQTEEVRALVSVWNPEPGPAQLFGAARRTTTETAAYLNGVSAVTLELDEGNKHARGHAACHAFPAALAVAQARHASGPELAAALVIGHEVASRFGRATLLKPGIHPHGNWGAAGAAAAAARLLGLDAERTAAALDVASETVLATAFESALAGSAARDGWVGIANLSGIAAARAAAAGSARVTGIVETTLGTVLGTFNPEELTAGLGRRFDITEGYFKRHASCSYTHPPADAVLSMLQEHPNLDTSHIASITIETHQVAAALDRNSWPTRLAAMFSIPYVVGAALVTGGCLPSAFDGSHRRDPEIRRLASIADVVGTDEFDRRLPEERGARVTLTLDDGSEFAAEVPNPVGDAAYHPFGTREIRVKLGAILTPESATPDELETLVRELIAADNVNDTLQRAL